MSERVRESPVESPRTRWQAECPTKLSGGAASVGVTAGGEAVGDAAGAGGEAAGGAAEGSSAAGGAASRGGAATMGVATGTGADCAPAAAAVVASGATGMDRRSEFLGSLGVHVIGSLHPRSGAIATARAAWSAEVMTAAAAGVAAGWPLPLIAPPAALASGSPSFSCTDIAIFS